MELNLNDTDKNKDIKGIQKNSKKTSESSVLFLIKIYPVSTLLILSCISISLLIMIDSDSLITIEEEALIKWGIAYKEGLSNGEYWRLLTSLFIHESIIYIPVSILLLIITLGFLNEDFMGSLNYLVFVLVVHMFSTSFSLYLSTEEKQFTGGLYSVVFGSFGGIIVYYLTYLTTQSIRSIILSLLIFLCFLLFIMLEYKINYITFPSGGLISGTLLSLPFYYIRYRRNKIQLANIFFYLFVIFILLSSFILISFKAGYEYNN